MWVGMYKRYTYKNKNNFDNLETAGKIKRKYRHFKK